MLLLLAGGCATTIPSKEFIAKYTTNIDVPNPDRAKLPCRIFLGRRKDYCRIKDVIPGNQGGGFLGKTILWRCPAAELPKDFPEAYRPGDVVIDGRKGAKYKYVIQAYNGK
jgi:hypothetical protein